MAGPHEDTPPTPLLRPFRRRPGPGALLVLALAAFAVAWVLLQLWLHVIGIAASPVGWLISILGTLVGFVFGRGG